MTTPMSIEPVRDASLEEHTEKPEIQDRVWGLEARSDNTVTFLEFQYWAKIEREMELEEERKLRVLEGPWTFKKMIKKRFSKGVHHEAKKRKEVTDSSTGGVTSSTDEKGNAVLAENAGPAVTEEEWRTAARALRTSTWGSIFYLITTDILGWSTCPFVFASVGFGVGVAVYFVFGCAAFASGYMLYTVYCSLDSCRYPMISYGDLFHRVYGPVVRHCINFSQSVMQFCTVMVLILALGQVISQLSGPQLCYVSCMIIVMCVGMVFGSIRSLQRLGWICNLCVWMNITTFIIIMAAASRNGPYYEPIFGSTILPKKILPIKTFGGEVPDQYQQQSHGFSAIFNGIDSMVYSYSGAILFVAFMAEMRNPMDFWKGMLCAQIFICCVYIIFGAVVYHYLGQYSYSGIFQVIQPAVLRRTCDAMNLITGWIACFLYFNIGMKTVYQEVFQEIFKFPPVGTTKGKWFWFALGPLYWIVAFLVACAVPNLTGIVNFIGGLLGLNFTYSLPGVVFLGWSIHDGATLPGEGFNPTTRETTVHDKGWRRWTRGFLKRWHLNTVIFFYTCASLATSGMGTWAAVEGLIAVFGPGGTDTTSYSCISPMWPPPSSSS